MVSMKGILFTVLGAAAAAVVVGTMFTPEKRSSLLASAKNNSGNLLSKARSIANNLNLQSRHRAEFDQANRVSQV